MCNTCNCIWLFIWVNLFSQVTYWDVYDGSTIRELEGSQSGAINGMHITQDGKHFVTGMVHYKYAACSIVALLLVMILISIIQPEIY